MIGLYSQKTLQLLMINNDYPPFTMINTFSTNTKSQFYHQSPVWLVVLTILKNMKVNGEDYPIYCGKKQRLKPPTSCGLKQTNIRKASKMYSLIFRLSDACVASAAAVRTFSMATCSAHFQCPGPPVWSDGKDHWGYHIYGSMGIPYANHGPNGAGI